MRDGDLFSEAARQEAAASAPLAARMRPKMLDDVVGQEHLTGPGRPIRRLVSTERGFSVLLWGPPGCGKTTIAEVMAAESSRRFERLSAVSAGVKELRSVLERAGTLLGEQGVRTVLFVDEIHRFSVVQQDALLHAVEAGEISLVGATTENPVFSVTSALRSRSMLLQLQPVTPEAIEVVLERAARLEGVIVAREAARLLARRATGDVRVALGALEMAIGAGDGEVTVEHAADALGVAVTRLGKDDHYDLASVLIKSMRAGDVDAALHWLARLIQSGEDPRFVSRRLMIFASEDVGVADDAVLGVCVDAHNVVQAVGMPEGRYALAHAVVRCARAAKSRRVGEALERATTDVTEGRSGKVPEITPETTRFRPVGFDEFSYWRE
jgi:putative ATPase